MLVMLSIPTGSLSKVAKVLRQTFDGPVIFKLCAPAIPLMADKINIRNNLFIAEHSYPFAKVASCKNEEISCSSAGRNYRL